MRKILMVPAAALAVALAMISDQASAKTELKVQYVQWMDGIFNKLQEAFEAAHPEYSLTFLRVGFESHAARANLRTRSMTEAA